MKLEITTPQRSLQLMFVRSYNFTLSGTHACIQLSPFFQEFSTWKLMGTPTIYKFWGGQESIYTGFLVPNLCYGEYMVHIKTN